MWPVLFSFYGIQIQSYGVSKALAALVGAFLLGRAFARLNYSKDLAYSLVLWATVWGFVFAKVYYVLDNWQYLSWHMFGSSGFVWYGGLLGGIAAVVVICWRRGLPLGTVAGVGCGIKSGPLDIHVSGCLVGLVPVLLGLVRGAILERGMQPSLIVTQLDVACNITNSMPPGRIHSPMHPLHLQGRIERLGPRIVIADTRSPYRADNPGVAREFGELGRHVLGGFNRSMQHWVVGVSLAGR